MGKNIKKKNLKKFRKDFEPLRVIDQGQLFARVLSNNGCNFLVLCSDRITRLGRLCNAMKRGPRIGIGSYIVVTLRDYETNNNHCDIIAYGEPNQFVINLLNDRNVREKGVEIRFDDSDDEFKEFTDLPDNKNSIEKLNEDLDWLDI